MTTEQDNPTVTARAVPTGPAVQLRRVTPEDWPQHRALRLEALADLPIAYCESLEQAQRADDAHWQARAVRGSTAGDSFQVMAFDGDEPVATSVGFVDRDVSDAAALAGVYVAPAHRGSGLLGQLVEQVAGWARDQGLGRLRLWVHEDNARAQAAYQKLGFVLTGESMAYPLDESKRELAMELQLGPV